MRIGSDDHTYEWIDNWTRLPDTELGRRNKAHHGIVVTESQEVVMFHEGGPAVLVLDVEGNLLRSWDTTLTNAHGMDLVKEGGSEYLWMADNKSGQVVKTDLRGRQVMSIRQPDLPVYREGEYKPTWIAVNQDRWGGNGDVWVADGYGESYVHRYDKDGNYISSINGEEGAGRFDCPHGIFIDTRKSEPELYISDRVNRRVQVYDLDGSFKRVFGTDFLAFPSGSITVGDLMAVVDLKASIKLLDVDDSLIVALGKNDGVEQTEGWPDVAPDHINPGKFNSPHGAAADADGSLYVTELFTGGKITKLAK